jgi:hypothetical protein
MLGWVVSGFLCILFVLGCWFGFFVLGCFRFSFWVPLYTLCVHRDAFVRSLGCWFGFPLYT